VTERLVQRLAPPVGPLALLLAAGAAGVGLLAGYDPRLAVLAAFGITFVVLVLQDLTLGVCMMVMLAFVDAINVFDGALSLAKVAGILLGASWLLAIATRPAPSLMNDHPLLSYALLLFVSWTAASLLWAGDDAAVREAVIRYAPNVLFIPIVFSALRRTGDLDKVAGTLVAGALLTAVLAIAGPSSDPTLNDGRAEGLAGGANELAAALVVGVVLCVAFVLRLGHRPGLRLLMVGGAGLCMLGIFLSLSRGGLLALGAALLTAVVVGGRWRRGMATAAVGLVAVTVVYFGLFASLPARERVLDVGNAGGTGRNDIWTIGWRMVQDEPVLGVGAGNFPLAAPAYLVRAGTFERGDLVLIAPKVAHNTTLQVLAETGVPGAALFVGIVGFSLLCLLSAAKRFAALGDVRHELLTRALLVALVGYLVAAFFISENYSKLLWLLVALGPATLQLARRAEAEAPAPTPTPLAASSSA